MQRSILFIISLFFLVTSVSGYGIYVKCPDQVTVGTTIKCSVDSDFPPGTTFDLIFSGSQTQYDQQSVIIQTNQGTQYKLFDTTGLQNGDYVVEIKFPGTNPYQRSDSVTRQEIRLTGSSAVPTETTAIPATTTAIPTTKYTTVTQTQIITTSPITPVISQPTISPSLTLTQTPTGTPTKSLQDLVQEQNDKLDAQSTLIAEQNKKLESQNNIL
ncbi:MAG: hypothetical protein ABFC78_04460, partial [Methanoregula sp.]